MIATIRIALVALLALAAAPVFAQEYKSGDIVIAQAWSRATPKGAPVAAGYFVIRNGGAAPDKLIGASAEFAGEASVHEMTMDGGVMRMREVSGGLAIPARGEVKLSPGGYHIMFTGLKRQLTQGETVKAMLNFERAGAIPVELRVAGVGASGPPGGAAADPMKGMKM